MRRIIQWAALLGATIFGGVAIAATASTPLNVTATIGAGGACSVLAGPLDFPGADGSARVITPLPNAIGVNCANGTAWELSFDAGMHYDGGLGVRQIQNAAGDTIAYFLADDAQTIEYGDSCLANTYSFGSCVTGTGIGSLQFVPVTGILTDASESPSNIFTPGTTYSDTVNLIVEF